jgi:predicted small secreted protein
LELAPLIAWRCEALKRLSMMIVAILVGLCVLSGCATMGGVVDGAGKMISKGGRAVKNI